MAKGKIKKALGKAKAFGGKHFHHPKQLLANAKTPAMQIGLAAGGAIAAQKWLNFKELFKDQYAKDPEGILFKHEGLIKVGGAIVTIAMVKTMPEWMKWLVIGIGIQGAIISVKQYTKDATTGKSFVDQIGDKEFEDSINALVDDIKQKSVAEQNRTGVGAGNELSYNSNTGVGSVQGMGLNDNEYGY